MQSEYDEDIVSTNENPLLQNKELFSGTYTTSIKRVDFNYPELCTGCDPVDCKIEGVSFLGKNWRDLLVAITEGFLLTKPQAHDLYFRSIYPNSERPFLLKDKPALASKQLTNGCWVYVNLSIKELVVAISKLCQFCNVSLTNVEITYIPKVNGDTELVPVMDVAVDNSDLFAQQYIREEFWGWLADQHPEWSNVAVTMHYSNAYYLYDNDRGVTLATALIDEDGFKKAYDAIEQYFINHPIRKNNLSGLAQGYMHSLRMLKEFLTEKRPELFGESYGIKSAAPIPDALFNALSSRYSTGFRFEPTYLSLLSNASGIEIDTHMQVALKRVMFRRDDDIYFLLDTVADVMLRRNITDFADAYLHEYGCFEVSEFYKLYEDKINSVCIRNSYDFEGFYEQICKNGACCVQAPYIGNRVALCSNGNARRIFKEVAAKIVTVISKEYYGSCNEEDLHTKFCAFSSDFIGKIIKQYAIGELVRVEINGSICYQTYDALGLPDNLSDVLAETLDHLSDIGLDPSREVLHAALSLKTGVNFMAEFNLPDWDAFQQLTAAFYKAKPRRKWKYYIFGEVEE